jgi:hypothetical protein
MSVVTRSLVAGGVAVALALAVPLSAEAKPHPYTPLKPDTWAVTIHPGTVVTHPVPDATFDDGVDLTLNVTGTSPAPTLALFTASQFSGVATSTVDGGATVKLNFGPTTRGVYEVTLKQAGTENNSYGVVTVITDDAAPTAVKKAPADPAPLARTGTRVAYGVVWGGASAIVLGLAFWVIARARRRAARLH